MSASDAPVGSIHDDARRRTVANVRGPAAPKAFLHAVARQQLTMARSAAAGWSVRAVCGAGSGPLNHLVLALRAGEYVRSEVTTGCVAWSVQVLQGRVCLTVGRARRFGWPVELLAGPTVAHRLRAELDTVLLVTLVSATPDGPVDANPPSSA